MRRLLARILAGIARITLTTVEVVVRGVRTLVSVLFPAAPAPLEEAAEDVIDEERLAGRGAGETLDEARRRVPQMSQPERIRRAAFEQREHREVSRILLDPEKTADAAVLRWMRGLDQLQLGMLVKATDMDIALHLVGEKRLRMPLVEETKLEAPRVTRSFARSAGMPLSYGEWVQVLTRKAVEGGDDDPNIENIEVEAERLAARRASLIDYRRSLGGGIAPEVIEDDEG